MARPRRDRSTVRSLLPCRHLRDCWKRQPGALQGAPSRRSAASAEGASPLPAIARAPDRLRADAVVGRVPARVAAELPRRANSLAVARPIPVAAPVMRTSLCAKSMSHLHVKNLTKKQAQLRPRAAVGRYRPTRRNSARTASATMSFHAAAAGCDQCPRSSLLPDCHRMPGSARRLLLFLRRGLRARLLRQL
jgi:hypothetical protein